MPESTAPRPRVHPRPVELGLLRGSRNDVAHQGRRARPIDAGHVRLERRLLDCAGVGERRTPPRSYAGREHHPLGVPVRTNARTGAGDGEAAGPGAGWTQAYVDAGDRVIVPCAGTAPVAIAAEREYGDGVDVLAIDVESGARNAYERRRADELEYQSGLGAFVGGESA